MGAFDCSTCGQGLQPQGNRIPCALACGHTFCKKDLDALRGQSKEIHCPQCFNESTLGKTGYVVNYQLVELLEVRSVRAGGRNAAPAPAPAPAPIFCRAPPAPAAVLQYPDLFPELFTSIYGSDSDEESEYEEYDDEEEERRSLIPNYKTKICRYWKKRHSDQGCHHYRNKGYCNFAHGRGELIVRD